MRLKLRQGRVLHNAVALGWIWERTVSCSLCSVSPPTDTISSENKRGLYYRLSRRSTATLSCAKLCQLPIMRLIMENVRVKSTAHTNTATSVYSELKRSGGVNKSRRGEENSGVGESSRSQHSGIAERERALAASAASPQLHFRCLLGRHAVPWLLQSVLGGA